MTITIYEDRHQVLQAIIWGWTADSKMCSEYTWNAAERLRSLTLSHFLRSFILAHSQSDTFAALELLFYVSQRHVIKEIR